MRVFYRKHYDSVNKKTPDPFYLLHPDGDVKIWPHTRLLGRWGNSEREAREAHETIRKGTSLFSQDCTALQLDHTVVCSAPRFCSSQHLDPVELQDQRLHEDASFYGTQGGVRKTHRTNIVEAPGQHHG